MGTISLKDLVSIPLMNIIIKHFIAYLRQKALCMARSMDVLTQLGTFSPSIQTPMDSPSWSMNLF